MRQDLRSAIALPTKKGENGMAIFSLALVLFGGMIFFALCGLVIERYCDQQEQPLPHPKVRVQADKSGPRDLHRRAC